MRGVRVPELGPPAAQLEPFKMTFLLPRELTLGVKAGTHHPCLHQCLLTVAPLGERDYQVRITGPSRRKLFDQAGAWLRMAAKGHIAAGNAMQIPAIVTAPARVCAGSDSWTIVVGADVAFAPTGLGAEFPVVSERS